MAQSSHPQPSTDAAEEQNYTFDCVRVPGEENTVCIEETEEILNKRLDIKCHSPAGFEWGYGGSGPSQLALAMLAHVYNASVAMTYYHGFTKDIIAHIDDDDWQIDAESIRNYVENEGDVSLDE